MEATMKELIRQKNWDETSLGNASTWPSLLSNLVNVMLDSRFPMFLFWGPELISFYNDAFRPSLGENGKHPNILGKPAHEAWEEIWDAIKPLLDQALAGEAVWREDLLVPFFRNGRIEDIYWTFSYSAIYGDDGKACGVLVICNETTEKILYTKNLFESENRFRNVVHQAPIGITIFRGEDMIVELASKAYLEIIDKSEHELVGKRFFDVMPDLRESVEHLLISVMRTGEPYYGTEFKIGLNRYGNSEDTYFDFVYYPLRDDDKTVSGVIVVASEVTQQVKTRFKIEESERKFKKLLMDSPIPMSILRGPEFIIDSANRAMAEDIWKRKEVEFLGKKLFDAFPELQSQKYADLLSGVYNSGIPHRENESPGYVFVEGQEKTFFLDFEYTPLFDESEHVWGVMVTLTDVTEKVEARKRLEESEEKLNIVIDASELGIWELNFKTKEANFSDRYLALLGYNERVKLSHEQVIKHLHPDDLKIREEAFKRAYETGILNYSTRIIWNDGSIHWVEGKGKLFYDDEGKPLRMLGTLEDITKEKQQTEVLERSEQKFRLLAETMPQFIWTASPEGKFNYHNERIYRYSDVSRDAIDQNGIIAILHPDDVAPTKNLWEYSVAKGETFLIEHRFRKYDGSYHWQLSRAVPQKDTEGRIQMWVGTSTDIQEQKSFSQQLEQNVRERTKELAQKNQDLERVNYELQSFAYVSSHDLQEPLRKIQTFASRIRDKEELSETGADYFRRIQNSAHQMQMLIQDLLAYTSTAKVDQAFENIDLDKVVEEVKNDFGEILAERNAVIESGKLFRTKVIPLQFKQVIHNLISNSLKFSRPGVTPKISIFGDREVAHDVMKRFVNGQGGAYCRVSIVDNGIGFDPRYKEKIFEVFQRLHGKHEYEGTGVGLAIVKRIIENHSGFVEATSEEGHGARFDIYLPVN